jgi:hypothetical protein
MNSKECWSCYCPMPDWEPGNICDACAHDHAIECEIDEHTEMELEMQLTMEKQDPAYDGTE